MALIQAVGHISKISSSHLLRIPIKDYKSLFLLKRNIPSVNCIKSVHALTQTTYRYQIPLTVHQCSFQKAFSSKFFNHIISRTLFSSVSQKHSLYIFRPLLVLKRYASTQRGGSSNKSNQTAMIYVLAIFIFMVGAAYAGVPLYKVFCQATGRGGQAISKGHETDKIESMKKVDRQIKIRFNADVASSMRWNFRPQQTEVTVMPGETALAFYTAKNPTDKAIIGISTYNVLPFDAGQYFNKIQCFCFEEQRLNPKEQVDMPVFFYIDPEFAEDPKLENVSTITLSYTFFEAKEGLQLPLPGYPQPHDPVVLT